MGLVRKADLSLNINESILRLQVSVGFLKKYFTKEKYRYNTLLSAPDP
jgi:hypothetical protein